MDSTRINVPLRTSNISGKKMRKRRELDALVAANGLKRYGGYNGEPVCAKPGTNYHDQLLSESTDEQEDYWRIRNKAACKRSRTIIYQKLWNTVLNFVTLILTVGCVVITGAMLFMISTMKDETNYLRNEVNEVMASNQGIPESLQKCHLQTKELQKNQSDLYARFTSLNLKFTNLTSEIFSVSHDLSTLQESLNLTMKSFNVPLVVKKFSENIMSFKKSIQDLNNTITEMSLSESKLKEDFRILQLNISNLKYKVPITSISGVSAEHMKDDQKVISLVNLLSQNVTYLNSSLTSEIQLLKNQHDQDFKIFIKLKEFLNQNISSRLNTLQNEMNDFSKISYIVDNLTHQFNVSNTKLKTLSDKMDKLLENSSLSTVQSINKNTTS